MMNPNIGCERIRPLQHAPRSPPCGGIVHDQFDPFMFGQMPNDFGVDPFNRLELPRPISLIVRPCEPGRGVGSHSAGIR